ncbi:hypothetical protein GTR02_01435 [Kineococcus sp. R8]|uniref:hypothetical protein n=1 Tax=Kineococcus siccus TaxID=2696567 RepID=UPI0014121D4B|nr:hypothetical protein [Kineococcus siccus]NAZ80481.1 hypothetical protein [Kineococcus siccus]
MRDDHREPALSHESSAPGLDLSGLKPIYVLQTSSSLRRVVIGCFVAVTGSSIPRILDDWPVVAEVVVDLVPALFGAVLVGLLVFRPPAIALLGHGVRLRTFVRFGPLVAWSEVADVKVRGRWDDEPSIRLPLEGHLRRRSLRGMPDEGVQRLTVALARLRQP